MFSCRPLSGVVGRDIVLNMLPSYTKVPAAFVDGVTCASPCCVASGAC
jgi:hypothetical protein